MVHLALLSRFKLRNSPGRYWAVLGWCESLPKEWKDNLKKSNLPCVISPLHDKDVDKDTGELQKPHYHILLAWDGPTTFNYVQDFAKCIGLGTYVEKIRSISNLINYMTHDSYKGRGKHKYNSEDIEYINCKESDFIKTGFKKIIGYIQENKIYSFRKLVESLYSNNEDELLEFVAQRTYYVNLYVSSLKIDIEKDIAQAYNLLKGYADEIDKRGKFTIDRDNYCKLLEIFEQLDIFADDL